MEPEDSRRVTVKMRSVDLLKRIGKGLGITTVVGIVIFVVVMGFRFYGLRNSVVVVPFTSYDKDTAAGRNLAVALVDELKRIRNVYSREHWAEILGRAGAMPEFFVSLPPVHAFNEAMTVVEFKPVEVGSIRFAPDLLVLSVVSPPGSSVITGQLSKVGEDMSVEIKEDGRSLFTERGGEKDGEFVKRIAHGVVLRNSKWMPVKPKRAESFVRTTMALESYQRYLEDQAGENLEGAEKEFRKAVAADESWEIARLNLAIALYTEGAFGGYDKRPVMKEASKLFGGIPHASPHYMKAAIGSTNSAFMLVHRFYDTKDCSEIEADVSDVLDRSSELAGLRDVARRTAADSFALEFASGNALFIRARLHVSHLCGRRVQFLLGSDDVGKMFKDAEAHYKEAERRSPAGISSAQYARVKLYSLWYSYAWPRVPEEAARIVKAAVELQEKLPREGEADNSFAHGLLAENYRRRAVHEEGERARLLGLAERQYEAQIGRFPGGLENTWARLRLGDLLASRGEWSRGMRTFVQALGGDELEAPAGTMHTLDGVLFVPTVHLSAAIRLLDKLLTINVDAYNVVGKLARAEALAQAGNVNEAVAALAPLERELACEAVLGSKGKHGGEFEALPCQTVMGSWLGPEIKAKVLATKAKMLARAGRRGEALEALRQVEDMKTVAGRDVVAWDLAEVGIVLGDGDRAERYCDIVRQRLQGALAEARRASLVVGRTCGSKMVRS